MALYFGLTGVLPCWCSPWLSPRQVHPEGQALGRRGSEAHGEPLGLKAGQAAATAWGQFPWWAGYWEIFPAQGWEKTGCRRGCNRWPEWLITLAGGYGEQEKNSYSLLYKLWVSSVPLQCPLEGSCRMAKSFPRCNTTWHCLRTCFIFKVFQWYKPASQM